MKSIDHLHPEEQRHFIKCDCGEYIDMRDLSQVFKHLHASTVAEPEWTYAVKVGEPFAYSRTKRKTDLN